MKQLKNHALSIVSKLEYNSTKCKTKDSKPNSPSTMRESMAGNENQNVWREIWVRRTLC